MNQTEYSQPGPAGTLYHAVLTEIFEYGEPDTWEVEYSTTTATAWGGPIWVRYFASESEAYESLRHYLTTGDVVGGVTVTVLQRARDAARYRDEAADPTGAVVVYVVAATVISAVFLILFALYFGGWRP